jgi:hypothetical protein
MAREIKYEILLVVALAGLVLAAPLARLSMLVF